MDIVFRVDANRRIGYGHLSRCLALAGALRRFGLASTFAVSDASKSTVGRIAEQGHGTTVLNSEPKHRNPGTWWRADAERMVEAVDAENTAAIVVDRYGLDHRWERRVAEHLEAPVVVVDGLARRRHDCDLLVDPTYSCGGPGRRWSSLLPARARLLAGPRFALLREEFTEALARGRTRDGTVREVLVAFGGSDPKGATKMGLEAVLSLPGDELFVTVVAGGANPHVDRLKRRCNQDGRAKLVVDTDEMARLMNRADLAVGAAGTMTWERAFLGLPAVVVTIAANQLEIAEQVDATGAIDYVGRLEQVDVPLVRARLERLIGDRDRVARMVECNRTLMGNARSSGAHEVARQIYQLATSKGTGRAARAP